jgi:flagellar hook-basal body complex protein FliE
MSVHAIAPMASSSMVADVAATDRIQTLRAPGVDFAAMIGEGLERVDESLRAADSQVRSLAAGEAVPLHEVMISMERARMDLMLVVEVRNRLVEAYQELARMQL